MFLSGANPAFTDDQDFAGDADVIRRTFKAAAADNILGWAAEVAYYFFLAHFPALLFFVALASFFPIHNLMDQIMGALGRFAPGEVLSLVRDQLLQISNHNNGGPLTLGLLGTTQSPPFGSLADAAWVLLRY